MKMKRRHSHRFEPTRWCYIDSGGSSTQTVQQNPDPWSGVQPYLKGAYADAQELYNQGGPDYFPGKTYVNRDPLEDQAMNMRLEYANTEYPGQYQRMKGAQQDMLSAADVANNPYVNNMIDSGMRRMNQNLQENILPGIDRGAVGSGQFGGSRHGVAQGIAMRGNQEALGDYQAKLQHDAYKAGLDQRIAGTALNPIINEAGLGQSQAVADMGAYRRGEQELALQDQMDRFAYNEQQPYANLNQYLGQLAGAPWGSTSTGDVGGQDRTFASRAGGGLTGMQAGAGLASLFGATGGSATALKGLGALAGFLSDRRAKKNIHALNHDGKYQWYTFEYRDPSNGKGLRVGVMADEVEKITPEAVYTRPDGYKAVYYGRL